jgi:FkbM family methyltransferase
MFGNIFKNVIIKNIDRMVGVFSRRSHVTGCRDHHFLNCLDTQSLVIDLGAHKGEFSTQISGNFGCRCISVEANPQLFEKIVENPLVRKFNYAICSRNGPISLYLSDNPEATSLIKDISDVWGTRDCIEVPGINFEDFLGSQQIKNVDLLKVDIEGMEIEMFDSMRDETIRGFRQIAVEFHAFCNPAMAGKIPAIKKRLRRLGFICLPFPFRESFGVDCDTLFINKTALDFCGQKWPGFHVPLYLLRIGLYLRNMMLNLRTLKNRL